jgi:ribosome-binding factor A
LTVSQVKVTDDLKIAKIYISFLENKKTVDELILVLKDKTKLIRHYVGLELNLKYIPELRFYHDDTMQYAEKINKLINTIHHDD